MSARSALTSRMWQAVAAPCSGTNKLPRNKARKSICFRQVQGFAQPEAASELAAGRTARMPFPRLQTAQDPSCSWLGQAQHPGSQPPHGASGACISRIRLSRLSSPLLSSGWLV